MSDKPKILVWDVETAPKIGYIWGIWQQNISMSQLIGDTYMLCWAAKWLDDDYVYTDALHYHKDTYRNDPTDDSQILKSLWKMLDEADYVVAHNGDRFDTPTTNTRFLQHGMKPPSKYKSIDTLKIARYNFKLTSNRLDAIGEFLKVGRKIDTGGFKLWRDIVQDRDTDAFDRMVEYNEQDVFLLEKVFKKIRSWDNSPIPLPLHSDLDSKYCNACGSHNLKKHGTYQTKVSKYQRFYCNSCGHTMRSRYADKLNKDQRKNILRSI